MRIAETQLVRAVGELDTAGVMSPHDLAQAVKQFLMRKRLLKRTGKIVRALERYEEEAQGVVRVQATTAHPLSRETAEFIQKKAETLLAPGKEKVTLSYHEDKMLLGGVRLETADTRYDFSLQRALQELRKSLSQ